MGVIFFNGFPKQQAKQVVVALALLISTLPPLSNERSILALDAFPLKYQKLQMSRQVQNVRLVGFREVLCAYYQVLE